MNKPVIYEEDCYNYSYGSFQNENFLTAVTDTHAYTI